MTGSGRGCLGSYLMESQEDTPTETETVTGSGLGCLGSYLSESQEDTPIETENRDWESSGGRTKFSSSLVSVLV